MNEGLKSIFFYTEAVNLMKQANEMCRRGGFNLCKFLSIKREILQEILEQDRADAVKISIWTPCQLKELWAWKGVLKRTILNLFSKIGS